MKRSLVVSLFVSFFIFGMSLPVVASGVCGDGRVDEGEVCDWGTNCSDVAPNACRTDCRMAYCGDSVIDNGEECDDGQSSNNANVASLKCRNGCKLPKCGDGIVDSGTRSISPQHTYYEDCDDKNNKNDDGCLNSCKACVVLNSTGNIEISDDTNICSGVVTLDDYGDYGTIIIKKSGITLDCNHAKIKGQGRGVGIMIFRSHDVTIRNCEVYGYEVGIKGEDSNNVTLTNNRLCGNSIADFELNGATQMNGSGNACGKPGNWNDTGKQGCSQNIPMCNLPTAQAGAMIAQRPGINSKMVINNMPHVTAQPKTAPVAPLSSKAMKATLKPVQAAPAKIEAKPVKRKWSSPIAPKK